jgi:hypothetical protein
MFMERYLGTVPRYSAAIGTQVIQGVAGVVEEYEERGGN